MLYHNDCGVLLNQKWHEILHNEFDCYNEVEQTSSNHIATLADMATVIWLIVQHFM